MILSTMIAHAARRVLPLGSISLDFDLSAVVLDTGDICADLAEGFSRGPFVSVSGAAHRPAVRIAPPSLAETPFA